MNKTISISDDIKNRLNERKEEGLSYSGLLSRLMRSQDRLKQLLDAIDAVPTCKQKIEQEIKKVK